MGKKKKNVNVVTEPLDSELLGSEESSKDEKNEIEETVLKDVQKNSSNGAITQLKESNGEHEQKIDNNHNNHSPQNPPNNQSKNSQNGQAETTQQIKKPSRKAKRKVWRQSLKIEFIFTPYLGNTNSKGKGERKRKTTNIRGIREKSDSKQGRIRKERFGR